MKSTENGKDIWMGVLDYKEVKLTDERLKKGVDTIINIFKKEDMSAGKIYNEEKFRQQLIFDGISNDKRTGTDGDWLYESKKDGLFIIAEVEESGKEITKGQEILMKNFVKHMGGGYRTYGFVLWHNSKSSEDISLKDTLVREVYYKDSNGSVGVKDYKDKIVKFKDAFDALKR